MRHTITCPDEAPVVKLAGASVFCDFGSSASIELSTAVAGQLSAAIATALDPVASAAAERRKRDGEFEHERAMRRREPERRERDEEADPIEETPAARRRR